MPPICSKPRAGSSDLTSNEAPTTSVFGSFALCPLACGALVSSSVAASAADLAIDHTRMTVHLPAMSGAPRPKWCVRVRSRCQAVGRAVKCIDFFSRTERLPAVEGDWDVAVEQQVVVKAPEVEVCALVESSIAQEAHDLELADLVADGLAR